jgi:hypothetical protein
MSTGSDRGLKTKKNRKVSMSYTPLRTQYAFDLSGVKCKTRGDLITLQRQWDTFERVENADDIVYQKITVGNRGQMYYQFLSRQEATDYKNGQIAHINRYPWLPCSTFNSIRYRAFPITSSIGSTITVQGVGLISSYTSSFFEVPSKTGIPNVEAPPKICTPFSPTQTSSEYLSKITDLNTYMYVSTFNSGHVYKYIFTSDEEKMSYYRAERTILSGNP